MQRNFMAQIVIMLVAVVGVAVLFWKSGMTDILGFLILLILLFIIRILVRQVKLYRMNKKAEKQTGNAAEGKTAIPKKKKKKKKKKR